MRRGRWTRFFARATAILVVVGTVGVVAAKAGNAATLLSITVTPAAQNVPVGETQQYTATGHFSDLSTADITTSVTWSSSLTGTATISNTSGSQGKATAVATGASTITATSGLISGVAVMTVVPAVLVSISVTPAAQNVPVGNTQQYTATGTNSDLSTADLTDTVTWSSSSTSTATISNTSGSRGLATAKATGAATITATDGSISGIAVMTVIPAVLVSITVSPPAASVAAGDTQQFTATGTFSDLSTADLTDTVTWSSSSTSTATISNTSGSQGVATAKATGAATITATDGSVSGTGVLSVLPAVLVSISVSPAVANVPAGETQQFTATGTYSDLSTADLTDTVTWSSSSTSTATVSNTSGSQGLATAKATGAATITATDGSTTGTALMTVLPAVLVSISVSPAVANVPAGDTQQFTATGAYSDLSTADLTDTVTWSSSSTSTATVSNTSGSRGLATAEATGAATITATDGSITGTALMTVLPAVLVAVTVAPPATTVSIGHRQQFTATGAYSDLSTADLTNTVTWSSSSTSTATVSNTSGFQGLATAKATGAATITATDGTVSGTALMTVTPALLLTITVSPASTSVQQNKTVQFTATGTYSDLSTANVTSSVTWSSSSTPTATISNSSGSRGKATGRATGQATITATDGTVSGAALLTVTAAPPASLIVSPTSGKKRTLLRIGGANFTPSQVVTVNYMTGLSNPKRAEKLLCTHHADSNGAFTCTGKVPRRRRSGPAGKKTIVATQPGGSRATATFTLQY